MTGHGEVIGVIHWPTTGHTRGLIQAEWPADQGDITDVSLVDGLHRTDEFGPIVLQTRERIRAKLVIVRHDILGFGDVVDGVERLSIRPVLGNHRVGPWLAGDVVEEEPVTRSTSMHRGGHLTGVDQAAHVGDILDVLILHEEAIPRLKAIVGGGVGPGIGAGAVIHTHGHEVGQALHDKRLTGGPDHAAPDQVVHAMHRSPNIRIHPAIGGPLDSATSAVLACY